jgi:ribonuclease PH
MRNDGRAHNELRRVTIERNIQPHADASVLIKAGGTHVLCGVSVEEQPPPFLLGSGRGWITAEYGILPCATSSRYRREAGGRSGRTLEIQRLIGRSLRMMVDLSVLGERTLRVDCDVLNADGGTRTASITGGALAVADAIEAMVNDGRLSVRPTITPIVAISAGIVEGRAHLDLDYKEDSSAQTDANFVMTSTGDWVETQATAEATPFNGAEFSAMTELAQKGCTELLQLWKK